MPDEKIQTPVQKTVPSTPTAAPKPMDQIPTSTNTTPPEQIQPQNPSLPPTGSAPSTNFNPPPAAPGDPQPINIGSQSPGKKIFKTLLILIILVIIMAAGSFVLAYNNYSPLKPPKAVQGVIDNAIILSPLPKPTRVILETSISKSKTLKSADQKTRILIEADSQKSPIKSAQLTIAGPIEFESKDKQAAQADIFGEVKLEGASFSAAASVISIDDTFYFKITEVPLGNIFDQYAAFKNRWFFVTVENAKKTPDNFDKEKLKGAIDAFIAKSKNWTQVTSQENDAYNIEITPSKKDLSDFVYDILASYQPKDQEQLLDDIEKENLNGALEKLNNLKITATIDKNTFYLKNIHATFELVLDNIKLPNSDTVNLLPANQIILKVDISTELSNYNKQVVIVPPVGAEDLERLLHESLQNFLPPENQRQLEDPNQFFKDNSTDEKELDDLRNQLLEQDSGVLGESSNLLQLLQLMLWGSSKQN